MAPFGEALIILWVAILTYGAHALLAVIQETAAGNDQMTWPGDPWTERLASFGYLLLHVCMWLGPVWLLGRVEILLLPTPYLAAIAFLFFWFIFPVSLLSALSSPSGLAMLRLSVLANLLRMCPSLFVFYLVSGTVLAGALGVFGLVIFMTNLEPIEVPGVTLLDWLLELSLTVGTFLLIPGAALIAAAGVLIYARLVGRLGLLVRQVQEQGRASRVATAAQQVHGESTADPEPATLELLPLSSSSSSENVVAVRTDDVPLAAAHGQAPATPVETFRALPPDSDSRQKAALGVRYLVPSRLETRLLRARSQPEPPRWVFFSGVYSFPFRRTNLRPLLVLTLGNLIVGVVLYLVARIVFG